MPAAVIVERTGDPGPSTYPSLGHGVTTPGSRGAGTAVEGRRRWPGPGRRLP
jgi:hypothetical protein